MNNPAEVTYIGKTDFRNSMTRFGIKALDRTKHMYVIGKTGTGKSTFLESMLVQDIANGNGLAFIDPHGGSAEKLLEYIPEHRIKDVIYLNPADTDFPVAFNPLEDIDPSRRPLIVDGLMTVFKKIWPDAFSGRMEYILNNAMLALLEYPDPTLLSINRMLTDKDFRKRVIANITDPTVKNAWDELSKWDDKRWSEAIGALINKVGQFTTNPTIRNIVGQTKSSFDFRKAMDERKILIINLSKGRIGEQNQPLFGAMLITKIYLAAMSRSDLSAKELEYAAPFYFYVDEFQNFANDTFANILAEARKYKLCLTVANQYVNQMTEMVRDAVFGNMGTTIAFRVGPLDSPLLEKVFTPVFTANDLENLQFGQYYITLQIDNMGSRPFSAQALWPMPAEKQGLQEQVVLRSRADYSRPREDVEKEITEWFGYNKKPEPDQKEVKKEFEKPKNPPQENKQEFKKTHIISNKKDEKSFQKNNQPVQKQEKIFQNNYKKPEPVSQKINDLLDQLEKGKTQEVVQQDLVRDEVKKELPKQKEGSKILDFKKDVQEKPVIKEVINNDKKIIVKKPSNDRFAKPETKNALLEALQKAQAMKQEQKTKIDIPVQKSVIPSVVVEKQTEVSSKSLHDILKDVQEEVSVKVESIKKASPEDVFQDSSLAQQKLQEDSLFQMPKAQKEVPEEILKKLLE